MSAYNPDDWSSDAETSFTTPCCHWARYVLEIADGCSIYVLTAGCFHAVLTSEVAQVVWRQVSSNCLLDTNPKWSHRRNFPTAHINNSLPLSLEHICGFPPRDHLKPLLPSFAFPAKHRCLSLNDTRRMPFETNTPYLNNPMREMSQAELDTRRLAWIILWLRKSNLWNPRVGWYVQHNTSCFFWVTWQLGTELLKNEESEWLYYKAVKILSRAPQGGSGLIIIDNVTSVFDSHISLPHNHTLFENLIVKKIIRVIGEGI
ncbi:hypothetical protein T265_04199 [Opisthorchis viverrini]|uniref:Uncharacterized protein n=1 Tax=Opisthorchis viverrini TaxID=6198 RepID=A0A075AGV8_OPIVI|nr:hypothetical protein T265_04199 [Opisthorchis viverrini]KER29109.1 hypothetical protein T265_04199 [Opisthorchis viverrini]